MKPLFLATRASRPAPASLPLRVVFAALIPALLAGEASALGGTVRTGGGAPVVGAVAFLASDTNIRATTDSTGAFTLNTANSLFDPSLSRAAERNLGGLSLRGGSIRFALRAPVREASLAAFSGDGVKRFEATLGALDAGAHEVAVPALAARVHYLRVTLDGGGVVKRLLPSGASASVRPAVAAKATGAPQARVAGTAAVIDTLIVRKWGYLRARTPLESYARADLAVVPPADTTLLPAITDYSANGPFTTVVEANVGPGNAYTIFRPETLGTLNGQTFLHSPLIYGHGINGQASNFTNVLRNVASHGFVIIARNVLTNGPNHANNTAALNNGLNWMLQQDTATGSVFRGKLATDRAASMGFSVGGTAAVDIGGHPAIKTVVSIHGHVSNATLRGTLLQTSGTQDNVGLPMQRQTFDSSDVQTFLGVVTGAPHGYIESNNGGVQRPAIVAWLRYWIYNDQGAKHYFYGNDCVMCVAPWENPQRKHWN